MSAPTAPVNRQGEPAGRASGATDAERGARVGAEAADRTTGRSVLGDSLWITISRFTPQINALILSVVAARILGKDDLGRQSFIAFIEISLISLIAEGFSNSVSRHVAREIGAGRGTLVRSLYRWAQRAAVLIALAAAAVMFIISLGRPELRIAWLVSGLSAVFNCLNRVPSSVLVGMQRWRTLAMFDIVIGTASTIGAIVALQVGAGITGMFVATAAGSGLALVIYSVLVRPAMRTLGPGVGRLPAGLRVETLRYALLLSTATIITIIVWRRSEFIFLDHFVGDGDLAIYSIAFAASAALMQLPTALALVAMPAVATLDGARSDERIRSGVGRGLRLAVFGALPVTAAALAGGPALIEAAYGAQYREAGTVLLIMAGVFPAICVILLSESVLVGIARQRFPLVIGGVGAVLNIVLDLVLIPSFGVRGAAVASVTAQLVTGLPIVLYLSALLGPIRWHWGRQFGCALASAAGFAAMFAVLRALGGGLAILPGLVVGLAGFLAVSALVPVLSDDDGRWLLGISRGRGRGLVSRLARLDSRAD